MMRRLDILLEDWLPQSPDLNPIENMWGCLNIMKSHRKSSNEDELFAELQDAWKAIPVSMYLGQLVNSMPKRLNAVFNSTFFIH